MPAGTYRVAGVITKSPVGTYVMDTSIPVHSNLITVTVNFFRVAMVGEYRDVNPTLMKEDFRLNFSSTQSFFENYIGKQGIAEVTISYN